MLVSGFAVGIGTISATGVQNEFNACFFSTVSNSSGLQIFFHKLSARMEENIWIVQDDKEEKQRTRSIKHSFDSRARCTETLAKYLLGTGLYFLM